ncbi:DinB family protein [Sphingobacterium endophyticum]|uniref:DinB family protein n=1 Tax=Sphingobacterium endophyticum TaxID=2546448 RepID=UPI0012E10BEB|nr:DinB family protein [Sphingobacterium endophyticum]
MSIKEGFLIELERETNSTRKMLDRLKDEHLDFKPHEKSMSLGALAGHVVELHNWISGALTKNDFNMATDYVPFRPTSVSELLRELDEGYKRNEETLNSFPEEEWYTNWTMRVDNYVIAEMPKIATIRFVINNHLIHHRGQLSVYLRLLDIPVPGMYGPSADEHKK